MDSSSNLISNIALRILVLVVIFSAVVFTAKADDEKKKNQKETKVTLSADEQVFFGKIVSEVEQKAQKAMNNTLHQQVNQIVVVNQEGQVILETTEASKIPANAEKLMNQGKIAFYIVNL